MPSGTDRTAGTTNDPIFIIGVDHSGTTILYRMMARHEDLGWFSQYSLRGGEIPGRARLPLSPSAKRLGRRFLGVPWRKDISVLDKLRPLPRESVGVWKHLVPRTDAFSTADDATPEVARTARDALDEELRSWRRARMLVKVPYLTRKVRLLDRVFPEARFIHIVRDGKAVALSNRDRFETGTRTPQDALRAAAQDWVDTIDYVAESASALGGRYLQLHYEEFCDDVHGGLARCFAFAGLDAGRADLGSVPASLRVTNDTWFERCSGDDRALIDGVQAQTLRRHGYRTFGELGARD